MYGGYDAAEEEWELERYGLEPISGSEGSEAEDALYRQIHYNLADNDEFQTGGARDILGSSARGISSAPEDGITKQNTGTSLQTRKSSFQGLDGQSMDLVRPNLRRTKLTPISPEDEDASQSINGGEDSGDCDLNDIEVIWDDDDLNDSKYKLGNKSQKITKGKANLSISHQKSEGDADETVIVIHDSTCSESDVIVLEEILTKQKHKNPASQQNETGRISKTKVLNLNPVAPQGSKATKINRDTSLFQPQSMKRRDRKDRNVHAHKSEVILVSDDSPEKASGHDTKEDSENWTTTRTRLKRGIADGKDESKFFIDSKGMELDGVRREKAGAQSGWREEREKTKAMLKEKGFDGVVGSSGDEDCMVIESCSEDEDMHVHFERSRDVATSSESKGSKYPKRREGEAKAGRYFVQSWQKNVKCHNCFEMGHTKAECPKPRRVPSCILCGTKGHIDRVCPRALCFNCSLPGHQSKACPMRRNLRYAYCDRCQMQGHIQKMCPDLWRQYHLTTEIGPLVTPASSHFPDKQKAVYCCNCSQKGHRYYDCTRSRFDEFTLFTYDEVCRYDARSGRKPRKAGDTTRSDLGHRTNVDDQRSDPGHRTIGERRDHGSKYVQEDLQPHNKKRKFFLEDGVDGSTETDNAVTQGKKKHKMKWKPGGSSQHELGADAHFKKKTKKVQEERTTWNSAAVTRPEPSFEDGVRKRLSTDSTVNCFPFTNQGEKILGKEEAKEKRRLRKERKKSLKALIKFKMNKMDVLSADRQDITDVNIPTRQPESGFVLNDELIQHTYQRHGNKRTTLQIASQEDDFPRSGLQVTVCSSQGRDDTKAGKKGRKLHEKMKHKLTDLRTKINTRKWSSNRREQTGKKWSTDWGGPGEIFVDDRRESFSALHDNNLYPQRCTTKKKNKKNKKKKKKNKWQDTN